MSHEATPVQSCYENYCLYKCIYIEASVLLKLETEILQLITHSYTKRFFRRDINETNVVASDTVVLF